MKRLAVAALIGALTACGGSEPAPLAPSPTGPATPPFPVGTYWLLLTGYDPPGTPAIPACDPPAGEPPAGKRVAIELDVQRQGPAWVGRPTAAVDLELRFTDSGELPLGLRGFSGTLRGQAPDGGIPGAAAARDVAAAIEGPVAIDGQTAFPFSASVLSGKATGSFRFTDSTGRSGTCSVVSVTMVTDRRVFAQGVVFMDHLPSR
jgi:hypothetical protein